ncbi:MAG TPA: baseplate J/gp47 family protein [Candidatus Limnocylindrales bacterium]|nr:baseplate J/gp47 family protein [Candidatus Limnocylindrales bacterium]
MATAPTIVYLDADDEITSAATRIRQATGSRVALVIPYGSRVATSRINFKLLTREAMVSGKRLDIVAPDASARALAASAGIPVFASVGEYESALDRPDEPDVPTAPIAAASALGLAAAGAVAAVAASGTGAATVGSPADPPAATDATAATAGLAAARPPASDPDPGTEAAREAELDAIVHRGREVPVARHRRRGPGMGLLVGLFALVLVVAVAGVAGFLFLPSAEITVTPRIEPVGPVELIVRADPEATAVDEDAGVIPAQTLDVPVEVSADFPATGKRVEKTAATGGVRWRNCDNSSAYTVPRGTIVRTRDGVSFRTDEELFLPVAVISGTGPSVTLKCQTSEVAVTAVDDGPNGNVDAGAIRVIPARYNRTLLSVTNPAATTGGKREEFTRVSQKDVDAALATLGVELVAQFETQLENPDGVPPGATAFPETAVLGESTPTADPATLVDQEVESFTLGLTATGSVLTVDASPVEAIAAAALADAVTAGYELVAGSTRVVTGDATVRDGTVTFPVAGSAKQLRPVDGEALRVAVLGLTEDEARAVLAPYGEVKIILWPDFVMAVPTLDQRVTLTVAEPVDETPDIAPVPPTPEPTDEPAGSPADEEPSEPLPSG